jgi:hypothetical protein
MSLSYYSRMSFTQQLLPLLTTASITPPFFSRSLSVLSAGFETPLNLSDLDLKTHFSLGNCANHTITMNSLMTTEFAKRNPDTSFMHTYPAGVDTGLARDLPGWAKILVKVATPLFGKMIYVSADDTGERQLFIATSGIYTPLKPGKTKFSEGVARVGGMEVAEGTDGVKGSGGYLGNWTGGPAKRKMILEEYREKGVGEVVWEHTMGILKMAEKVNERYSNVGE